MLANYETERQLIEVRVDFEELTPANKHAITIIDNYGNSEYLKLLTDTSHGANKPRYYFMYGAERVYVDSFIHIPFESINTTNGRLDGRALALSMMAHGIENVGVYMEIPCFDYILPELGFGILGDKKQMMLCKITEKSYKVCAGYKIELTPALEVYQKLFPNQRFYIDDFAKIVKSSRATIVNLAPAMEEEQARLNTLMVKLNNSSIEHKGEN